MTSDIRPYRESDEASVLALSLRAWAPVYDSMERVLGREIVVRLHGEDWHAYQADSVRGVLGDHAIQVWVSEDDDHHVVGFVAAHVFDAERAIGEVVMLAVDPAASGRGRGTALTEHATAWLRDRGMRTAMIGTGGDPGHAAARRTNQKADYTPIPMARYFKAL